MNPEHEIFIQQLLLHGDRERAYLAAYPKTRFPQAAALADILAGKAEIKSELARRRRDAENRKRQRAKPIQLLTVRKKREVLAQMVSGEWRVKKHVRIKDLIMEVYDDVSPLHMMRAMELDSKLAADYWKERQYEQEEDEDYNEEMDVDNDLQEEEVACDAPSAPTRHPYTDDHQQHYQPYAKEQTPEQELHRHDEPSLSEHINKKFSQGTYAARETLIPPTPEQVYELQHGHKPIAQRPPYDTWLVEYLAKWEQ